MGKDYPTKYFHVCHVYILGSNETPRNFDLEDVHVEGAERIAEAVAKYDVDRFIHVSSHNVDKNSPSEFFRTKVGLTERCERRKLREGS